MHSFESLQIESVPLWELGERLTREHVAPGRIDLESQSSDPSVALAWLRSRARRA